MSFLQPTTSTPKTTTDYKKVDLEVDAETVHELDQIEFHRQSSEMLYSIVASMEMSENNLHSTIINMQDQMKIENASLYAKDLRIKPSEELVL